RIFGSVQIGFWTTSIWKLAVAAIFACFVSIVFTSLFPNDWFTFGITTVLIAAVFLGVLLVLRFADIDELRRLVKRQAYTVDGDQESVTQFPGNI
ncbi:MAG: hypothetical protein ACRD6X_18270, partial [Pyrinomonadaceae bacterium]